MGSTKLPHLKVLTEETKFFNIRNLVYFGEHCEPELVQAISEFIKARPDFSSYVSMKENGFVFKLGLGEEKEFLIFALEKYSFCDLGEIKEMINLVDNKLAQLLPGDKFDVIIAASNAPASELEELRSLIRSSSPAEDKLPFSNFQEYTEVRANNFLRRYLSIFTALNGKTLDPSQVGEIKEFRAYLKDMEEIHNRLLEDTDNDSVCKCYNGEAARALYDKFDFKLFAQFLNGYDQYQNWNYQFYIEIMIAGFTMILDLAAGSYGAEGIVLIPAKIVDENAEIFWCYRAYMYPPDCCRSLELVSKKGGDNAASPVSDGKDTDFPTYNSTVSPDEVKEIVDKFVAALKEQNLNLSKKEFKVEFKNRKQMPRAWYFAYIFEEGDTVVIDINPRLLRESKDTVIKVIGHEFAHFILGDMVVRKNSVLGNFIDHIIFITYDAVDLVDSIVIGRLIDIIIKINPDYYYAYASKIRKGFYDLKRWLWKHTSIQKDKDIEEETSELGRRYVELAGLNSRNNIANQVGPKQGNVDSGSSPVEINLPTEKNLAQFNGAKSVGGLNANINLAKIMEVGKP
jgi:hypothetical protein